MRISPVLAIALLAGSLGVAACSGSADDAPMPSKLIVDSDYYTLPNGLKVVVWRGSTVPTVGGGG